jgi:hypothetical protein
MAKVVINCCYGGFGISRKAVERYLEIKGTPYWITEDTKFKSFGLYTVWLVPPEQRPESKEGEAFYAMTMDDRKAYNEEYSNNTWYPHDVSRDDSILIQVIEELGEEANGDHASLKIVNIPDGVEWQIEEYDGKEWVAEKHRTWS